MAYSDSALEQLRAELALLDHRQLEIYTSFHPRTFRSERAREYAVHGFTRRIGLLIHSIRQVFEALPPESKEVASRESISDATVNIQAFILNVFGSIDNLAWVWVLESDLKNPDGSSINRHHVGLGKKHVRVRQSLSHAFQAHLQNFDAWFEAMGDYRDALAHRIPLYIPPYEVPKSKAEALNALEVKMNEAISRRDFLEYDRLSIEQRNLGRPSPYILHSFGEKARPIMFHGQMLADLLTVDDLAKKMINELDELSLRSK